MTSNNSSRVLGRVRTLASAAVAVMMMSVSVGSAEAGNARTAIPVVSSCLEKRATLGKAQFRHRYRSMQACSEPRSVVLDRFNRANTDTLQPIWEGTPYRLSYSDIAVRDRQATQFDASRNYSVAQWKQPVAVTKAFAVTMRNGFNSPNRHPSLDNHELFLNIAHDLGDLTIVPTAWLSPLGGYELGVYAGYDRAGNEDFGNAMWELYRFDVPGYTTTFDRCSAGTRGGQDRAGLRRHHRQRLAQAGRKALASGHQLRRRCLGRRGWQARVPHDARILSR